MKVAVAADAIGHRDGVAASEVIAQAFADSGAVVAVVPLATGGRQLGEAVGRFAPGALMVVPVGQQQIADALESDAEDLVLDLAEIRVEDLGRSVLGRQPRHRLDELRERWRGRTLTALVREGQEARELTGLKGFASIDLRVEGADLAATLAADAEAERWVAELGLTPGPGAGAARGLGLVIQTLGGRVVDPITFLMERSGFRRTVQQADLVVTGAEEFDFHGLGGPVVKRVAAVAGESLRPVIAVTGRSFISARELRLGGFEATYPLLTGPVGTAAPPNLLAEVAARVARTWVW